MLERLAVAVHYAYPIALCMTLMGYRLATYRLHVTEILPARPRHNRILFVHQCIVICLLGISIALEVRGITWHEDVQLSRYGLYKAEIIGNIAVLLYFAACLLPVPDESFSPDAATKSSWLVAVLFEVVQLIVYPAFQGHENDHEHIAELTLGFLRALILLFMVIIHSWSSRPFKVSASSEDEETSPLLSQPRAGQSQEKLRDAQSMGWLDYFSGFYVLFPYIWPSYSKKHQLVAAFCFGLLLLQRAVNILVPYQLEVVTLSLSERSFNVPQLILYIIYRGIQGQQGIIGSFRAILWIPISQRLFQRLSCDAFEHVLSLSLDFHLHSKVGEVITALSKGGALNTFFDGFVFQLFPMVFDLVIAATYVFIRFDAIYSLIVIGVLWGYIFVTINMAIYRGRVRRQMAEAERGMNAAKVDAIMAYETVHYNRAQEIEGQNFRTTVQRFQTAEFSVLLSLNGLNVIQNTIFTIGIALVTLISAYQISQGTATVAAFVSLLAYFTQLHSPLAFFGSFFNQVQNNLVDAERMLELVRTPFHRFLCSEPLEYISESAWLIPSARQFTTKPTIIDSPNALSLAHVEGRIAFENVNFAYNDKAIVLHDLSFVVEPRTMTAIVGESGSGKSTCLKLLFRFYDVLHGKIMVDENDIRHVKLNDLRRHMAVVPQQQDLFHTSIENNVLYSNPNACSADVQEACQIANIHDRIMSFPDRYQTIVGERGLRLSGGEKQRIVLARALLKRSPIMLLDEATASLDSGTEALIQQALEKATVGRTTVIIAHRLSTLVKADQILVMDRGRIAERGTHDQLLRLDGLYRKMWEKQIRSKQESDPPETEREDA